MDKKKILVTFILVSIIGALAYFGYQIFIANQVTLQDKLEEESFVLTDDYYVRDVVQDEITYEEILVVEDNVFMRISDSDLDREVYSYNYETETFNYLYYFDDELILELSYNYETEKVILDESEVYESLTEDISSLKTYFTFLLTEYEIEIEEL